jgi:hypothetical protein
MRSVSLARVAAQAEILRLREFANRTVTRIVLAVVAVFFLVAALVAVHVAAGMALTPRFGPLWATLIVGAVDLVIALILAAIASSSKPSRIEREAMEVRRTAQAQLTEAVAVTTLIGPLARLIGGRKLYAVVLAALTARYLGARR